MRFAAFGFAPALWLVLGLPLPAQQAVSSQPLAPVVRGGPEIPTSHIPTIHVESRLVSVMLNVTDEHGATVPGLAADDFELAEDGKPQRIAVFERESSTPLEVVLAIDASGSVFGDEHLERDAAKSFVHSLLRPKGRIGLDRIDLMSFADAVDEVVPFTNDAERIDRGLGHIKRGDATALYDAVSLACERLGETASSAGQRRVLVLLTDGENTTRHGSYDAALEQAQRAGVAIYPLILVPVAADAGRNTGGEHALIQMARDTGGRYYYVEDGQDLGPAFQHVSADLRTQYTVDYYAPAKAPGGVGLRHIQLQLRNPALRARYGLRYRTAYYANP